MEIKKYIVKFRQNDYSDFKEFYNETYKQIYFTALAILKNKEKAEDIMQETYISFLEHIEDFKIGENIFAYLTVIAKNKSINILKKDGKISYTDNIPEDILVTSPKEITGVEEILSLLENTEDREIITYHVILGYKFKEIADITEKPLGTVLWKYNKAIKFLKNSLENNF